ncbi:universal stress protein [Filimonas effusa]|uniref:Universal stress protein n=1 Tax=Filimonas effusa TaxID=2508721 RepID=A0A4Q1D924_9BACT|nr:universal stress protein [Filimonas effusa]RXK85867.1 universal stress protein [Filimonas effusa]
MQSILVLTDFSDAAFQAVEYAAALSRNINSKRIVLLNAFSVAPFMTNEAISPDTMEQLRQEAIDTMDTWQESVKRFVNPGTEVNILVKDFDLSAGIDHICESEHIDLVVMGITNREGVQRLLVGSNAIRVMANTSYPLLIVPREAAIQLPRKIILATDLSDVAAKIQTAELPALLKSLEAKLLVVNVAEKEENYKPEWRDEITALHNLLAEFDPQFHYVTAKDTVEGILQFATGQNADLVITIHEKQGLIARLFNSSTSKSLAWETTLPLLVIPV